MARAQMIALAAIAWVPVAAAEPTYGTRRVVVDTPVSAFAPRPPGAAISPYLYLNRCRGGCTIHGGANDAANNSSSIPAAGDYTIGEFTNAFGQIGTTGTCLGDSATQCTNDTQCGTNAPCDTADSEWAAFLQCMTEVYSPFAVTVTDAKPMGVSYTMAVVAGQPTDIGEASDVLGIAPLANDCSAQDNVISFTFANHHAPADHAINVCWTAAQESAHAFGLDHEWSFPGGIGGGPVLPTGGMGMTGDGESACNDPMTYSVLCGGEKFFRNEDAKCGEYAARACKCTPMQNSVSKLLSVFGPGQSIIAAPTTVVMTPMAGAMVPSGQELLVVGTAGSKRGVSTVEVWLNGSKWDTQGGTPFGLNGQANPSQYAFRESPPDSVIDVQLKAYDDLGTEGDSQMVTITKGTPCDPSVMNANGTVSTCLKGQKCDATGRCFWDPPTGKLGDSCDYAQQCISGLCQATSNGQVCVQACTVGAASGSTMACPKGYDCIETSGTQGLCLTSGGGCCSAGGNGPAYIGISGLVLAAILRRRPRR